MLDGNDLHDNAGDIYYYAIPVLRSVNDDIDVELKVAKCSCDVMRLERLKTEIAKIMDNLDAIVDALDEIGNEIDEYMENKDSDLGEEYEDI